MAIVFLDRDGTLIEAAVRTVVPGSIRTLDELVFKQGAHRACKLLRETGCFLVLVTNQPDISRGFVSQDVVLAVNEHIKNVLSLDLVLMCPHDDNDDCQCRKPGIGMLTSAAQFFGETLDLRSAIIGDRWRDIDCGNNAGITSIHVDGGHSELLKSQPHYSTSTILNAAQWFIKYTKE